MPRPYPVRLHLGRSIDDSVRGGRFDVELVDEDRAGTSARGAGVAFLDLREQAIAGIGLSVGALLDSFLRGDGGTQEDGLRFGQHLLARLLGDREVHVLWDEIQARREAEKRPLRLELILPADDAGIASDIPFELLADDRGFLFRRAGASLVRVIRKLPALAVDIERGDNVMVAWANPRTDNVLAQEVFDQHEAGTARAAAKAGLTVKAPCRKATRRTLEARLAEGGGTPIVSLVAHGDALGGAVYLHLDPALPGDPPDAVVARDLAHGFRAAGVRVALLWTCHGGKQDAVSGAVAATLLDPAHGDVAAVVASHAALRAGSTAAMVERLFGSLKAPAGGDLEQAVSEARLALPETDLQWAAPAYYARPAGGRTVTLAEALERAADSLRAGAAPGPGEVEGAPRRWPHFRGREDEIARGMGYLRTARLVSVTGMAGMGKTEAALAIAREAAVDAGLALGRVLWVALDGVTEAEAVRARLAFAFGAEPKDCPDDAALARRIGGGQALVVLDNAEDPIRGDRGGVRSLVATLLRECAGLRVMLATRERLGDLREADEHLVPVGKLGERDAREVFLSVAGERLPVEAHGAEEVSKLLAWLDGHALSLVLVAKQAGSMTLAKLLRRLETRGAEAVQAAELFGEEAGSDRDERLTRLVSSLELSYGPLAEKAPGAAEMFAWLGYFPAGLPGVLVPMVFGEEGEEQRAILLRKGLAEESGREKRLGLPAPVRAYARAKAEGMAEARRLELVTTSFGAMGGWMGALYARMGKPGAREAMESAARDGESVGMLLGVAGAFETAPEALGEGLGQAVIHWAQIMSLAGRAEGAIRAREALAVGERLARGASVANVLQALGDLYVRTARLKDAEAAYDRALQQFQAIDDRLGEANVLQGLGNLALRRQAPNEAFKRYLEARRRHRDIGDDLGVAADHAYMSRASLAAGKPDRAVVLLQWSLSFFASLDDHFSMILALLDLVPALGALKMQEPASAALVLAWHHAAAIGHPLAQQLAEHTGSSEPPSEEDARQAQVVVMAALADQETALRERGEDPYSPLLAEPGEEEENEPRRHGGTEKRGGGEE
jgi:tetratricopeptide (TPR) repeat protein